MKIRDLLPEAMTIGDPATVHGLGIVPLLSQDLMELPPMSMLDEAIDKGDVRVGEVAVGGQVPFLTVQNAGGNPVLILEGEELVGGKQNRIVNATILVLAGSVIKIPVSCVESGRWDNRRYDFDSGKAIFRARSRAVQKESVTLSLRERGTFQSDQGAVWNEVGESLSDLGISSATSDFRAGRERVAHRIEEFVTAIQPSEKQVGAIFLSRDGILGCELLATPELFRRCIEKIVRSFAFEVLSMPDYIQPAANGAAKWWEAVLDSEVTIHRSPGAGQDVRLQSSELLGSGLQLDDTLIHLSCFPAMGVKRNGRRSSSRRAAVSERRRRMSTNKE